MIQPQKKRAKKKDELEDSPEPSSSATHTKEDIMWLTPEKDSGAMPVVESVKSDTVPTEQPEDLQDLEQDASDIANKHAPSSPFRTTKSGEIRIWRAEKGNKLEDILQEWSSTENIELVWNQDKNTRLDKDVFISGTFQNAIDVLFSKGLKQAPEYTLETQPHLKLMID
ncbi:MAG: TcpQ domain-containing protein [Alphaproteobacteria bacterium]